MEKIVGKITWKKIYLVLCMGYGVLMFPLLWISKYNHMCADDYGYGLAPHLAWVETGSMIEVFKAATQVVTDYYDWWQGTYSSIFLMALQPGIFGEKYYFLGALFLYLVFHVAVIYLLRTLWVKFFKADKYVAGIATILVLVLLIQFMETPVQSFYFYNAGVHYIFMASVLMVLWAMQIRTVLTHDKKELWFYCVAQVILGIVLGGGNFITAFLFILTSLTFFFLAFWKRKKECIYCVPGFVFEIVGFIISAAAPGNLVRAEKSDGVSAIKAIILSFKYSLMYINEYISVVVLLMLFLLIPIAWKLTVKVKDKCRFPLLVVGYTYCIFASMFTPTCYALGYPGAGRCRNMYVMFLYLYLVFLEFYVVGWVRNKVQIDPKEMVKTTQVVIPFAFIAVILLVLAQDANNYMSLSAVKSMYYKEAQLYHVIHSERESQLRGDEQQVAVRTCPIRPHLLFFDDITTDAEDWKNVATAKWYGKQNVIVRDVE